MNNYFQRSQFYRYEFITKEDFPLIRYVLGLGDGPVIEVPCGAGRLLDIHSKHKRQVYMVDLEPMMVEKCQQEILGRGLDSRIFSVVGNMKNWLSPEKVKVVLAPRGGLQLLATRGDVQQTLINLSQNLVVNGIIYLDIADPWNASEKNQSLLSEFMRFTKSRIIKGKSEFKLDGKNILYRSYYSVLHETSITVRLKFRTTIQDQPAFVGKYQWLRIKLDDLLSDLKSAGFATMDIFCDYSFQKYYSGASRIICIAQKEE